MTVETPPSFGTYTWTRRHWMILIGVAVVLLAFYAKFGPGDDYFRCYTDMVIHPELLEKVTERVWTLNPPWVVPFMAPFVTLPGRAGYIVFVAATLAMFIYSTHYFGGKPVLLLLSAHMMWILWWGQIDAWGMIALVVGWIAVQRKSWQLSTLALVLASFKPQISFIPVVALWWWSGKDRWKAIPAMLGLFIFSLWVWGPWPVWYWQGIFGFVGDSHVGPWNASMGLIALPLFIPALLVPMNKEKRLIALTATALIVSPYMPYYSTIVLMAFGIPWWAYLFGFLGYLPTFIGTGLAWNSIVLMPILVLVWLYLPFGRDWARERGWLKPAIRETPVE